MTLTYGVGTYSEGKYKSRISLSEMSREYDLWSGMLQRCYREKDLLKNPTYKGCLVSDEFLEFQKFAEWCNQQSGFGKEDFHLDKDLLCKGNKLYSAATCVFIPQEVNKFMIKAHSIRGCLPVGVSWHRATGKFQSRMHKGSESVYLGVFPSIETAFATYKIAKEAYAKELAVKWCDKIDPRAYEALMNYTVEITD